MQLLGPPWLNFLKDTIKRIIDFEPLELASGQLDSIKGSIQNIADLRSQEPLVPIALRSSQEFSVGLRSLDELL